MELELDAASSTERRDCACDCACMGLELKPASSKARCEVDVFSLMESSPDDASCDSLWSDSVSFWLVLFMKIFGTGGRAARLLLLGFFAGGSSSLSRKRLGRLQQATAANNSYVISTKSQ